MFLIPIGRDDAEIRRHAWVSYTIIGLNVLAFLFTVFGLRSAALETTEREWNSAFRYIEQRPYLRPPAEMAEMLSEEDAKTLREMTREMQQLPSATTIRKEQAELNAIVARAVAARTSCRTRNTAMWRRGRRRSR